MHLSSVSLAEPFPPIAGDPVDRLIHVHAKSLASVRCLREEAECRGSPRCDGIHCRIIVNALRREIDRLVRGVDRLDLSCDHSAIDGQLSTRFESMMTGRGRPIYAPPPLGEIPAQDREIQSMMRPVLSHGRVITNLGSLLDILM